MAYEDEEEPVNWAEYHDEDRGREQYEEDLIAEFTADRLKSYYVDHPEIAAPAFSALNKAKAFLASEPEAALVFADSAIEITLKLVLLKPVVYGLVHTEAVATFVMSLIPRTGGITTLKELLFGILAEFGGVDLATLKRFGSSQTMWEEVQTVRTARNCVGHEGKPATPAVAKLAVDVGSEILEKTFPTVMQKLGLHLHGSTICHKDHE